MAAGNAVRLLKAALHERQHAAIERARKRRLAGGKQARDVIGIVEHRDEYADARCGSDDEIEVAGDFARSFAVVLISRQQRWRVGEEQLQSLDDPGGVVHVLIADAQHRRL